MPRYTYQSRNGQGTLLTGQVSAQSVDQASQILHTEGKFVTKLTEVADDDLDGDLIPIETRAKRVKRAEVIYFTHQLAIMIETGVPMSEALDCLTRQVGNDNFKAVLEDISATVQAGGELSLAMKRFPKVFPKVMTGLVRASEASGTMGPMLGRISEYLAKEQQILRQARGALTYPLFMLFMTIGVTVFLLMFVLPRFGTIYETRNAVLPLPTQALLSASSGAVHYWYYWLVLSITAVIGFMLLVRTALGRRLFDGLKLKTPVIGNLFSSLYLSRACRTMGTMIDAGVPILDSVSIVRYVTGNVYYDDLWERVDDRLRQGAQLSEPLFQSRLIPRSIAQMIYSGEKAGRLGQVMSRVATVTEEEFDDAVKTTTQFIEPLMVVVMGSIIGFVAVAMLMPIFSVGRVMAGN